ncbi:hypothetical protein Mpal_1674 [Methanosphaerula palustris E1-9c]|uniref:Uncharacterized protein n=1 Tax=Methanosphaerula palustris (strain ATCC BAA-1556 / DSM 19958 / E1-9c) TaxID=521011 RepID=B8GJE5_METPE|nr:hypothetical protein Mpal_1674 [Methanosphaerula palustris E1-9c]
MITLITKLDGSDDYYVQGVGTPMPNLLNFPIQFIRLLSIKHWLKLSYVESENYRILCMRNS